MTISASQAARRLHAIYDAPVEDVRLLGAGDWSQAFGFIHDGRELVVRFGRYREDFDKDARVSRQSGDRLPIPVVESVGETADGYYAISRRAHGRFLDALDAEGMRAALPALSRTLETIWSLDISHTEGYGLWNADGVAPDTDWHDHLLRVAVDEPGRIGGWRARLAESAVGTDPFDAGFEALTELVKSCPNRRDMIHCDLLNRNVMVEGDRITAIFDWANSLYGDGLYDLAWLRFWWPWHAQWSDIDIDAFIDSHLASSAMDTTAAAERLRCYQLHIGLEHQAYHALTGRHELQPRLIAQTNALFELCRSKPCCPSPASRRHSRSKTR